MTMKRLLILILLPCAALLFPVPVEGALPWWTPVTAVPEGVHCATAPCSPLTPGDPVFLISGTTVLRRIGTNTYPEAAAPVLPSGSILAAPALYPGTAVAATPAGTMYRRSSNGKWHLSLQLLPNLPDMSPPHITGCAAMPGTLTGAVYCSTDGDGMFVTTDAGITWYRANDGLPLTIDAVIAVPALHAFAAQSGNRWYIHVLRPLPVPSPPRHLSPRGFWILTLGSIMVAAVLLLVPIWHWREKLVLHTQ